MNNWAVWGVNRLGMWGIASSRRGIRLASSLFIDFLVVEFVFGAVRGATSLDILENVFVLTNLNSMATLADRSGMVWDLRFLLVDFLIRGGFMRRMTSWRFTQSGLVRITNGDVFNCLQSNFFKGRRLGAKVIRAAFAWIFYPGAGEVFPVCFTRRIRLESWFPIEYIIDEVVFKVV